VNFENIKVRLFLSLSATVGNALDCRERERERERDMSGITCYMYYIE
jgi:hypothetical protein